MNYKTIKTKDGWITVDLDAEIKNGDYGYNEHDKRIDLCLENNRISIQEWWNKIIIAYPSLEGVNEYSCLPPIEDDVEKLVNEHTDNIANSQIVGITNKERNKATNWMIQNRMLNAGVLVSQGSPYRNAENIWLAGYKAAKQEGCFTEEDMIKFASHSKPSISYSEQLDNYKKSLKQPEWEFEVEEEFIGGMSLGDGKSYYTTNKQPKIINNKVQGKWIKK